MISTKKIINNFVVLSFILLSIVPVNAHSSRAIIVPGDSDFYSYKSRTQNHRMTLNHTGIFLDPGDSLSVQFGVSDSVSNNSTIAILPELLEMGYSRSLSVSASTTVTVNNPTNSIKEAIAYKIYDNVYYYYGHYLGDGTCSVSEKVNKVYKGYLLSCQ